MMGYWLNMPRLAAEAELAQRRALAPLTADSYYDLIFAVSGGNRDKAERAFIDFRAAQLRAGVTPE